MPSRQTLTLGGLLVVAVTMIGCGGSIISPTSPTPTPTPGVGADVTIQITRFNGKYVFSPNPGDVAVGQTVAFSNYDSIVHTATADNGAFNTGNIAPGATSAPITMSVTGAFNYHDAIHSSMVGTLTVFVPSDWGY